MAIKAVPRKIGGKLDQKYQLNNHSPDMSVGGGLQPPSQLGRFFTLAVFQKEQQALRKEATAQYSLSYMTF